MVKIIFFFWMLSGKVKPQLDTYGYQDYNAGRKLFKTEKDSLLYKGEVLNYIRTGVVYRNECYSDKNGKIVPRPLAVDTVSYTSGKTARKNPDRKKYPVYKDKKGLYVIDYYTECKIYLK